MTGTANYIPYLGILMMTVWENNRDMPLVFHLFVSELPEEEKARLQEAAKMTDSTIYVHVMNDEAFSGLITKDKPPVFFYRFIIADVVNAYSDRVLYLDGDIMCNGSLTELKALDMSGYIAAVFRDMIWKSCCKRLGTECYFNAGAMMINTNAWHEGHLLDEVLVFAKESHQKADKHGNCQEWGGLQYNDQNILNKILDKRVIWFPKKYDYIYKLEHESFFKKDIRNDPWEDQIILHFAGYVKPWHSWVRDEPVVREYTRIWQSSPWKVIKPTEARTYKDYHRAARAARAKGHYSEMLPWYGKYVMSKMHLI